MFRFFMSIILFSALPFVLYPQSQDIKFEHISVEEGLSNAKVQSILQDYQGFIWFATNEGLNKYDGYKFTTYRHDPQDSTSLSSNSLSSLYEDPSGNLWISTIGGGLNHYNRNEDNFINYRSDPNNPDMMGSDVMQQTVGFTYDGKAVLWIGTQHGLNKMEIETQKFKHYPHTDKGFPYSYIEAMAVDSSGLVWIGGPAGLYKFDPGIELFTNYQNDPENPNSLSDNSVLSLLLDSSGIFWVGTINGGLNKFDTKREQFISYQHDPDNLYSLSNNWVSAIYEDRAGILWVGTAAGGLNRFDPSGKQFIHYKHDPGNPNSLSDNTVICIYEDISGVLWVGTWDGINKFDPEKIKFSNYMSISGNRNSVSDNYIWSICGPSDGGKDILWIGTKTGGLNKLDRKTGKFTPYQHDPNNSKSIPSSYISALFEDRAGILWIGTYGDGLIKFDPAREQFTQYLNNPDGSSYNIIRTIFEDKSGILWIGNQNGGLNKFNRETGQFSLIGFRTQIMQIYEDQSGVLWIAALSGLKELNRDTGQYTTYWHDPDDPNSISSNKVISIYEDRTGRLWFGTIGGGLNKFNREAGEYKSYTMKDGLSNDVINGILEDTQGNLWVSTNNGLSKFNPETELFRNYDIDDGLLGNQFNPGVCFKSKDGELFFGGTKGLNAFYPERLRDNVNIPEIVITDFQIFNEPVAVKQKNAGMKNNVYTLPKHFSLLDEIELSYKENVFSFEFAALDYRSPQNNKFAYMMVGVDPKWVFTDASRRFATYTNLDPGKYTFRVKGSNNDGVWNEDGKSIRVIITPPWWRTILAYAIYLFLFGFLVFATWYLQLRRIRLKQQLKMEHFETEKLREVDQMKSRFIANISHEFRTPLTLIEGPVKQLLEGEFFGNVKEQYKMILRNSGRLLGLINQILDLSKLESGEIKLQVAETDIIQYLKGMVLAFSSLAESKKVTLKFSSKENSLKGFVDRDKLEKIVTNLISNAFKFTPEGGEVEVSLSLRGVHTTKQSRSNAMDEIATSANRRTRNDKILQLTISNTGPGIPPDQLDKIFDRFYQTDDNYKEDSEGTGIGLALTKEIVEVCRGEISVSSTQNKITSFFVTLPVAKECFKEDELGERTETADRRLETGKEIIHDNSTEDDGRYRIPDTEELSDSKSRSSVSGLRPPLLLIVEDNPDVTSYISSFMEKDYCILTAENGKEGLKKTLDKYPDLIISDVMMPEMDGFEFCHKVKSDERLSHIPVILLTAKADLDSKIKGLEFGADDYVTKPFEARELQIRSKNLIEQRRKLREKFSSLIDLKPEEIAASSMDEQLLQRLLSVFEEHMEEPEFSIEQLAREVGISRRHLNRKIQAITNLSTSDFIRTLRLQRAARLLRTASGTVSEIAYQVGFNNLSHFSKAFRKHYGKLPSEFSRRQ